MLNCKANFFFTIRYPLHILCLKKYFSIIVTFQTSEYFALDDMYLVVLNVRLHNI